MTFNWKVLQYFTVVLFVCQLYSVCNLKNLSTFDLALSEVKWITPFVPCSAIREDLGLNEESTPCSSVFKNMDSGSEFQRKKFLRFQKSNCAVSRKPMREMADIVSKEICAASVLK